MITGEYWGESTIPTTRLAPASASSATASGMRGAECSMPTSTACVPGAGGPL